MARYKDIDTSPRFIAVDLQRLLLLPGSFEHALNHLIDHELNLSSFDAHYSNDASMKQRIDSAEGRARYAMRFGTVEPVFGNLRYNKGLDRFTLRGRAKVDAQWKLFCLVHNIEKLANHGYAA